MLWLRALSLTLIAFTSSGAACAGIDKLFLTFTKKLFYLCFNSALSEKLRKVPLQHSWARIRQSSLLPSLRFRFPTADYQTYADYQDYPDADATMDMLSSRKALAVEDKKIIDLLRLKKVFSMTMRNKSNQDRAEHNRIIRIIRSREGPKKAPWTFFRL